MNSRPEPRHIVLAAVIALTALGSIVVFSSTAVSSNPVWVVARHFASILIGIALMYGLSRLDYRAYRGLLWKDGPTVPHALGVLSVLLLVSVLVIGVEINGAHRWFKLGPITFQPSEIAKIALIIFFADFFCRKQEKVREFWHGFVPAVALSSVCLFLIAIEPDFGTAFMMGFVILCMLTVAGFRLMHIVPSIVVGMVLMLGVMLRYPHVWKRLGSFVSGEYDFQVSQALIAVGSGGVTGTGLGDGIQKLKYVPLATTDFAFAVVGEETGLLGGLLLLLCYSLICWFGFRIALRARDLFGRLLASGVTMLIVLQAIINLYVVTGMFPNKGIPLPFISAGGSAMVLLLGGVGVLLSVCRTTALESEPELVGGRLGIGGTV